MESHEARRRYEQMVALGTASHSAAAWRTMAALLTETGTAERHAGIARCLFDRADDCTARAARVCTQATHDALKADRAAFDALAWCGEMEDEDDHGNPARLVMRNCSCGSTLCRQEPVVPQWLGILRDAGALA